MPLRTAVIRDGALLQVDWGDFHIASMVLAASVDSGLFTFEHAFDHTREEVGDNPIALSPAVVFQLVGYGQLAKALPDGEHTLKSPFKFIDTTDREVFTLLPGDVLRAWRE